jgi:hypothetical protein
VEIGVVEVEYFNVVTSSIEKSSQNLQIHRQKEITDVQNIVTNPFPSFSFFLLLSHQSNPVLQSNYSVDRQRNRWVAANALLKV